MKIDRPLTPPLGIKPKELYEIDNIQDRLTELRRAINEYMEEYRIVNPEWLKEYNDLLIKLEDD